MKPSDHCTLRTTRHETGHVEYLDWDGPYAVLTGPVFRLAFALLLKPCARARTQHKRHTNVGFNGREGVIAHLYRSTTTNKGQSERIHKKRRRTGPTLALASVAALRKLDFPALGLPRHPTISSIDERETCREKHFTVQRVRGTD